MENELKQLLELANTTIPTLVESYNESTREHNELIELVETQETKLSEYEQTIEKLTKLTQEQGHALEELQGKHKAVITVANDKISDSQRKLEDAKSELKELKKLQPLKMKKTLQEQKVKLAERLKALDAEKGKVRNANRELESVRNKLNLQKVGFWRNNQERLIENLNNKDLTLKDLHVSASMENMVWWQHECGLKLLFGFDKASSTVYCCDVIDPDTGEIQKPSAQALKQLEIYFKDKL